MKKFAVRETALELLTRIGEQGGFSHVLIDRAMKQEGLSQRDGALLTEIVYGTLQRRDLLAYYVKDRVKGKKKLQPWVKWLLYMSIYQMTFLDKIPDHAIIHEAVEIAKKRGHKGIASLVNGMLRNIQRSGVSDLSELKEPINRLAIETSHPEWMVKRWVDMYGFEVTKEMCFSNLTYKPMSVRVQTLKISRQDAIELLKADGYEVTASLLSPQGIIIESGNILKHDLFLSGKVTIQDQSSMLVGEMMDVTPGMKVLDACSAPGGKTTHIAEKMENEGQIIAYDLHAKKAKLVTEKAAQLDLHIIEAGQADSRNLCEKHSEESFDRILLDAPCSGLGVLRGKPDIKYHKQEKDIVALSSIQEELLESVAPLLKSGGKMIYSTCTVDREENERVVERFLEKHNSFKVDPSFEKDLPNVLAESAGISKSGLQLFPQHFDTDGFFLTRLVKTD
ncbi:16S rRNA (cytosine(967)-C(5))-methyltransferase RsmB [Thalassobacillus pellis]|uniref:16S rRNA (cytosine(967)-C(5))-methyltransferase RsmB n=1 Tax=Thalassobacillus pellis TaxID=748008 RepID=UPI00195FBD9D|nr:16S rRNA (cytosine(967)-C(5))-methyltransferase RsmB [Thalassobacillus pellis]MBM7552811.1 16S rRNA (cytosine967-C5)-methyltransferase [Thalassobacillus pellis]